MIVISTNKLDTVVSIIITNYNYEQYIGEAIESVLNQTYQNFEMVIVDDGSIDQSESIIKKYQSLFPNKIKVVLKENGGQGSAFNAAFEKTTGEIIAFLDADDYWYPEKLETIVQYHQKYNGIQHNLLINNNMKYTHLENGVSKQKRGLEKFGYLGVIPTSGMSFTKNSIEWIFPIPEQDYRICVDFYVKIMFLNDNDMYSIDNPLGCYRVHGTNQWFNSQAGAQEFNNLTLEKLDIVRSQQGKKPIIKLSQSDAHGLFMLDGLTLNQNEKYVIFGTGNLAEVFHRELINQYQIVFFSNSFVNHNEGKFLDKKIRTVEYLKKNKNEYDKLLIASSQLSEVTSFLLEQGFKEEELIIPRL